MVYKYQQEFAEKLAGLWVCGDRYHVRTTIRTLKNKAQAAYISGEVVYTLAFKNSLGHAADFISFMHPNNK